MCSLIDEMMHVSVRTCMQVLNVTRPSDFWLEVIAANLTVIDDNTISPHSVSLFTAVAPVDTFVNCSEFSAKVTFGASEYPQLPDMICSLILRGNDVHGKKGGAMPPGGSEVPAPGSEDTREGAQGGGQDGLDGGIVQDTDSAPGAQMHGAGNTLAWSVGVSMAAALAGLGM